MRRGRTALIAAVVVLLGWVGSGAVKALPGLDDVPAPGAGGPGAGVGGPGAVPESSVPDNAGAARTAQSRELVGLLSVTAGACTSGAVPRGSWFRMVQPNGNPQSGPFVDNNDSPCANKSATPLEPGRDGGLQTGQHQPAPSPAFDSSGNGLADRILKPARFYGVGFASATNPTDPQTGARVGAPQLFEDGGRITGDLRAWGVAWNRQDFNQGAPKPNGSTPGQTKAPVGTYNAGTGAIVVGWSSQIEGGPFNGFTGVWHIEGTFRPSSVAASGGGATGPASGSAASGAAVGGGAVSGAAATTVASASTTSTGSHPRTGAPVPFVAVGLVVLWTASRVVRRIER